MAFPPTKTFLLLLVPHQLPLYVKSFPVWSTIHNDDTNINYLIFYQSGYARIISTLFHDEILCAGEMIFMPRQSECSGIALTDGIFSYVTDGTHDSDLWRLKHKEFVWLLTRYFQPEELRLLFYPMDDEGFTFKSLVLTHHRKAEYTDKLAEMCGDLLHTFRRTFKGVRYFTP